MKLRRTEVLFVVVALAIAAFIVLSQVDKISKRLDQQIKARQGAMEVQEGGHR
jgi:hypothetical protein